MYFVLRKNEWRKGVTRWNELKIDKYATRYISSISRDIKKVRFNRSSENVSLVLENKRENGKKLNRI